MTNIENAIGFATPPSWSPLLGIPLLEIVGIILTTAILLFVLMNWDTFNKANWDTFKKAKGFWCYILVRTSDYFLYGMIIVVLIGIGCSIIAPITIGAYWLVKDWVSSHGTELWGCIGIIAGTYFGISILGYFVKPLFKIISENMKEVEK